MTGTPNDGGLDSPAFSVSLGEEGGGPTLKSDEGSESLSLSAEDIARLSADTEKDKPEAEGDEPAKEEGTEDKLEGESDEQEGDDKEGETSEEDLPDFEELTDEVATQYEAKYLTQDDAGEPVLNLEAFNAEFAKQREQEDGSFKRDLNPGTRKWLKKQFGISDAVIDQHLDGVRAQEAAIANTFYGQFGDTPEAGKQAYDTMFEWAKGTYTEAQKASFNEALKAGGQKAQDQLELLKTRYSQKNPQQEAPKPKVGLRTRSASPSRSATEGKTSSAPAPFANAEEHKVAQDAAMKMRGPERDKALADVRSRLQASQFWRR